MDEKSKNVRAEIFETGNPQIKSARIVIDAPAEKIFSILADPKRHAEIDGTKSIRGTFSGPDRLVLGSKFGMNMRLGINYHVTNTVMEFEENRLIAWRHLGRWRWRYELKPLSPSQTEVTETFDGTTSISQTWLKMRGAYPWVQLAVAKTLVRLKALAESS